MSFTLEEYLASLKLSLKILSVDLTQLSFSMFLITSVCIPVKSSRCDSQSFNWYKYIVFELKNYLFVMSFMYQPWNIGGKSSDHEPTTKIISPIYQPHRSGRI